MPHTSKEEDERHHRVSLKFQQFMEGRHQASSLTAPERAPAWLDREACRRGGQFYASNLYACNASSFDALLIGMCIPNFYRPLIFSRRTIKKSKSGYRYMETGLMVYSWYQDDLWEPESLSHKMMRRVNAMHRHVAGEVRASASLEAEVARVLREADIDCEAELGHQDRELLADLAVLRDTEDIPREYYDYVTDSKPFSQVDMALIQGAFFAPYLLYPRHYGVTGVSEADLEDFIKLWRAFGYYLGIDDAFNAVLPDLEDSRLYCQFVMDKLLKPCMLHLNKEAIYMAKTAVFLSDYHVVVYSKYRLVGFDLPRLWASFSLVQRAKYYLRQLYLPYIYPLPGVKQTLNYLTNTVFQRIQALFNVSKQKIELKCPI